MGLRGDQIDELRARVPLAYRPWDRPSAPVQAPANEVADVDDAARRLNNTLLNLARGDGDVAERTGYRAPGGSQKPSHAAIEEKKRREAEAKFAMDQARKALEDRIRWLEDEIDKIKQQRADIAEQRSEIADKIAAIDELKKKIAKGEKLDPNNPADRELARRAGISPEDLRRADLDAFLTIQRAGALDKDQSLQDKDAGLARKQDGYQRDLDKAKDLGAQMDANPDSEELKAAARRMTGTTGDVRDLAAATFQTDSVEAKATVAAIVAKAEDADARKESAEFNSDVVSDVSAVTGTGTADFSFDEPPAQGSVADGVAPTPISAPPLSPQFAMAADPASTAPAINDPQLATQPTAQPVRSMNG